MVTDPLIGRLVDSRYEIVDRLARGGMATVYRAHDRRLDRTVALKLMHVHLADSPDFVSRFRREARAAARLSNPGVVAVYDQGSLDGVAYLVMEYVEGPTLRDLIAAGPLSVKEALGLVAQLLRPLGAAHRAGLVHRDIKPENVLLPSDGSVAKVADFGLARAVTEVTQTTTGNVLGTVAYLAPELITSGDSTSRADVFSAGVVLYELLTGEQPFTADSPIQIAFRNVHEDVPLPSKLVPDMPADVDELVATMTRREPQDRPADADEALALLRNVVDELTDSELSVRRGGGTGSIRTQQVMTANAQAARSAIDNEPQESEDEASSEDSTHAGMRTVSLPIGSIGPDAKGRTRALSRKAVAADAQRTTAVPTRGRGPGDLKRRTAIIVGLLAVAGTGAGATWYLTVGPGRRVPVPNIVGMSEDQAQLALEKQGLDWGTPTRAYSDTVPAGSVVSCQPKVGQKVGLGQAVTAVISRGVETKTVPDVVGKTKDQASAVIKGAGLTLGDVTEQYSASVDSGKVISSDPKAGKVIEHTAKISIVVSKGKEPATIPDVTGQSEDEAKKTLEDAGLKKGKVSKDYSDSVAKGNVIASSPIAGASGYYKGDSVDLTISKGPEKVTIPDVTGKGQDEAKKTLEEAGLKVEVNKRLGGPFGTVRSTDPAPGSSVKPDSKVTINIF
ncbi:Stk1 family PASTA domain-containing Ser/Thr kinase [Actinomyces naeslundii]|uniref:non-specific serine/threonine protein kinase n=2 Tax=Actinomyces naeslundii TaxID=1655 RepID=J3ACX3_ACTNH|nr:Stk1 family PASTA domain-containing Ser/Thr kinase [Actinomyces naeslundii]EJN85798.1 putative serine/threonine-protein kinase PrkC [Actinomyces naeslundii str. Howell 279]OMG31420.1 serine/threonine protein kinase [Actinomyces naeslundii]QQC20320.1 Stk1 family PASTA domain-containing Ser/Thr kinase [Actinomyces naeslundii]